MILGWWFWLIEQLGPSVPSWSTLWQMWGQQRGILNHKPLATLTISSSIWRPNEDMPLCCDLHPDSQICVKCVTGMLMSWLGFSAMSCPGVADRDKFIDDATGLSFEVALTHIWVMFSLLSDSLMLSIMRLHSMKPKSGTIALGMLR